MKSILIVAALMLSTAFGVYAQTPLVRATDVTTIRSGSSSVVQTPYWINGSQCENSLKSISVVGTEMPKGFKISAVNGRQVVTTQCGNIVRGAHIILAVPKGHPQGVVNIKYDVSFDTLFGMQKMTFNKSVEIVP